MKKYLFEWLLLGVIPVGILWGCKNDFIFQDIGTQLGIDRKAEIAEAKGWYEAQLALRAKTRSALNQDSLTEQLMILGLEPDWEQSFRRENGKFKTVEVLMTGDNKRFVITSEEVTRKIEETKDIRYKQTMTRLIVLTNKSTHKRLGFVMTIVPSIKYIEQTDFKPFYNTYLERDKKFDGRIIFYNLDGTFANGWRYEDGKITHTIRKLDSEPMQYALTRGSHTVCTTYVYTESYDQCDIWCTETEWNTSCEYNCYTVERIVDVWEECYMVDDPEPYNPDEQGGGGYNPPSGGDEPLPYKKMPSKEKLKDEFKVVASMTVDQVYSLIGGKVLENHVSNPSGYANACTLRLSYALNIVGGHEIPYFSDKTGSGDANKDGISEWYFYRVSDLTNYLNTTYGPCETVTKEEIQGQVGIIGYGDCGWPDATGHLDIWDGNKSLDKDYPQCDMIYFWKL